MLFVRGVLLKRSMMSSRTAVHISASSVRLMTSVVRGEKDDTSNSSESSREYIEASSRFSGL